LFELIFNVVATTTRTKTEYESIEIIISLDLISWSKSFFKMT